MTDLRASLRPIKARLIDYLRNPIRTAAYTSPSEQTYLFRLAKDTYKGKGEIVDLGCLMGATTIALARGLRRNKSVIDKSYRIHAFDIFIAEEWLQSFPGKPREIPVGSSFYPIFLDNVNRYSRLICPYPCDLLNQQWHGSPVEILHSDASKSFELCNAIAQSFYPSLLAGDGLLIEQDFLHWYTPWVHLLSYGLREFLDPIKLVSTSMVFRCVKPIDRVTVQSMPLRTMPDEQVDESFSHSLSLLPEGNDWRHAAVYSAKAMFYAHTQRLDQATLIVRDAVSRGLTLKSDLMQVVNLLNIKV